MTTWYFPGKPADLHPTVWMCDEAIDLLSRLLRPEMDVLEHGSGGSTLWLSERVKSVTAYENDLDWFNAVKLAAGENTKVIYWDRPNPPNLNRKYDIILIDGEPLEVRGAWCKKAIKHIAPGGVIVLDNCNREQYAAEREMLQGLAERTVTIDAGVGRYLKTDFFFMAGANE